MIEVIGDIWKSDAIAKVVTTNGFVKANGDGVMGKGIALEAKKLYLGLESQLGRNIVTFGNVPSILCAYPMLISLPTKHHWKEDSSIALISVSVIKLRQIVDALNIPSVAMPRPGCGNGNLDWNDVKKIIRPHLDDRFMVYHYET